MLNLLLKKIKPTKACVKTLLGMVNTPEPIKESKTIKVIRKKLVLVKYLQT